MSYVVGSCNVVAILGMADMVCLELVSQARPFLLSIDHFNMRHAVGRSLDLKFHFKVFEYMMIFSYICTIYMYEFNSLEWGLLTLTPII